MNIQGLKHAVENQRVVDLVIYGVPGPSGSIYYFVEISFNRAGYTTVYSDHLTTARGKEPRSFAKLSTAVGVLRMAGANKFRVDYSNCVNEGVL